MSRRIFIVCNSYIGRSGNVGLRVGRLASELSHSYSVQVLSRGGGCQGAKNFYLLGLGIAMRMLNAFRMYIYKDFKSRLFDMWLFHLFSWLVFRLFLSRLIQKGDVLYITEPNSRLIKLFKRSGCHVLLDLPIAPASYVSRLICEAGEDLGLSNVSYLERFELDAIADACVVICPSDFVRDEVAKLNGSVLLEVVPFGVDQPARSRTQWLQQSNMNFCFAGNVSSRKGVKYLLEAWSSPEFDDHTLHLCGRISPEVKALIEGSSRGNIRCPGFVNTREYFKKMDVYVFPSLMEGSSKSIYEAMAAGMPIITTHESGSVVEEGEEGFIVPKLNSLALREAMLKFIKEPVLVSVMGRKAAGKVRNYTWQKYANQIKNIIETLPDKS